MRVCCGGHLLLRRYERLCLKGEKSAPAVYANTITRTEESDDGEEIERKIPFMRGYAVFNAAQIDGLPGHYYSAPEPSEKLPERIRRAERLTTCACAASRRGAARFARGEGMWYGEGAGLIDNADNLTVAPWGDVIVCEDGSGEQYLVGITPGGDIYKLARNAMENNSELAGATFSPDGSTLFVNIQHAGLTLVITGDWRRGGGH